MTAINRNYPTCSLVLKGLGGEGNKFVRFDDLLERGEAFKESLKNRESLLTGENKVYTYYRITDVSLNGVLQLQLQAVPEDKKKNYAKPLFENYFKELSIISGKKKIEKSKIDYSIMDSYSELSLPARSHIESFTIRHGRQKFVIDENFNDRMQSILGIDIVENGTVNGTIGIINVHNSYKFYIYPIVGAKRIVCKFNESLLDTVKDCLGKRVAVTGKVHYKEKESFPYRVDVKEMTVYPEASSLAKFTDLIGADPEACNGLTVEKFIAEQRDEW